ncbi:hypothetical protein KOI40_04215 [Aestuariicella sp. G3-2]|uniref:hypothetical protein n=1 Tax=Pseudomaricurvus albidus TaxID=2842452 RepID=UPI001C0C32B8|nr:hypothetical protein [Aestuariicella albida]MBU3069011.1 hypothetical protein [Aestuariicella albida]
MRLVLAFISAIALPTMIMTLWYLYGQFQTFEADDPYIWVRTKGALNLFAIVSGGFVLLLGLPTYLLMRLFKKINFRSTLTAGFVLGAIPMAIITWPLQYIGTKSSSTVNGVQTMIDGVPTLAGWYEYFEGVVFFGLFGFGAALVFWLVAAPNKYSQQDGAKDAPPLL